jgi:hypothetical protein
MLCYKVPVSFLQKYINGTANLLPRRFHLAVVNGYGNFSFSVYYMYLLV